MIEQRRHIPALDGLRGFAVLLVIVQHFVTLEPSSPASMLVRLVAASGWVGVDLFFLLSGFLITGILLDARNEGLLALRPFYARRALRILPPLVGLMIGLLLVANLTPSIDPTGLRSVIDHQWWQWTFLTNVRLVRAGDWNVFPYSSHLWSLAIEEQFYLLWPLIVLMTSTRTLLVTAVIAVIGALVCRLYLLHTAGGSPIAALVLLPSRIDELSLGALLAVTVRSEPARATLARITARIGSGALPLVLFLGVAFAVTALTVSQQSTMRLAYGPGLTAVALSAALLLAAVATTTAADGTNSNLQRWFSQPWLRRTGLYSYTLYLVHYPLIVLAHRVGGRDMFGGNRLAADVILGIAVGALSFTIAALSWHFLERPALSLRRRFPYADAQTIAARA